MRAASRTASVRYFFSFLHLFRGLTLILSLSSTSSLPCPNPKPIPFSPNFLFLRRTPSLRCFSSTTPPSPPTSSSAFDFVSSSAPFIEKQFEDVPIPEILEKAKAQIEELKGPFGRLAEILKECPSQYYRFHSEWSFEMRTAVSLLAFVHLVETGNLLLRAEAEKKLGLDSSEFYVDIEDHLTEIQCSLLKVEIQYDDIETCIDGYVTCGTD